MTEPSNLDGGSVPRIRPGSRAQIGPLNALITMVMGRAAGTNPPHLFTTLARHRGLFRRWLIFAGGLMPFGRLPRADTELVILRVAHVTGSGYEWQHHQALGARAGLTAEDIDRVRRGPEDPGWTARQSALLAGVDDLHDQGRVSDAVWNRLIRFLDEPDLIEFCLLVGHYQMLAMTLNTLNVQLDTRRRR